MSVDNPAFIYGRRGKTTVNQKLLLDGETLTVERLLEIAAYKTGSKQLL